MEKKQVVATAFLPRLEREREIGSETRIITQFCQKIVTVNLLVIIA